MTFFRGGGCRFYIKNIFSGEKGATKKPMYRGGNCLKNRGAWTIYRIKAEGHSEKEGVVIIRGLLSCTL